jgi:hypothetical protein
MVGLKGILNENGCIDIERAGKLKSQYCPEQHNTESKCGDWCPLFGEPYQNGQYITVRLCIGSLNFSQLDDYRR